jgi:hypothetical protein
MKLELICTHYAAGDYNCKGAPKSVVTMMLDTPTLDEAIEEYLAFLRGCGYVVSDPVESCPVCGSSQDILDELIKERDELQEKMYSGAQADDSGAEG